MGMTFVEALVLRPGGGIGRRLKFLVDTGAFLSVVPGKLLTELGIQALTSRRFHLADGSVIRRRVGIAMFRIGGSVGSSEVVFGRSSDEALLGALTLESLALEVDPRSRRLKRAKMYMMSAARVPVAA